MINCSHSIFVHIFILGEASNERFLKVQLVLIEITSYMQVCENKLLCLFTVLNNSQAKLRHYCHEPVSGAGERVEEDGERRGVEAKSGEHFKRQYAQASNLHTSSFILEKFINENLSY